MYNQNNGGLNVTYGAGYSGTGGVEQIVNLGFQNACVSGGGGVCGLAGPGTVWDWSKSASATPTVPVILKVRTLPVGRTRWAVCKATGSMILISSPEAS